MSDRHGECERRHEELLTIKAENSNLKAKLSKYETIIQMGDQREKEMNEELDKERDKLMKDIAVLEMKLSSQKHNKSVYSTSNYNQNMGEISDTHISSKNHYNESKRLKSDKIKDKRKAKE